MKHHPKRNKDKSSALFLLGAIAIKAFAIWLSDDRENNPPDDRGDFLPIGIIIDPPPTTPSTSVRLPIPRSDDDT